MDYDFLPASDGTGDAQLMHITADRSIGSTTIVVDGVANVPTKFIATSGTLLSTGLLNPSTVTNFKGHVSAGNLIIDGFEPGSTDAGNLEGQVVVIKPTTGWADRVAAAIKNITGFGTPEEGNFSTLVTDGREVNNFSPVGSMTMFAGSGTPTGWLVCDGTAVSRTTYAALFSAIGVVHGSGDGSTTFNLPDMRQRFPLGQAASGTGNDLGETGGNIDHTHVLDDNGQAQIVIAASDPFVRQRRVASTGNWTASHKVNGLSGSGDATSNNIATGLMGRTAEANPPYLALKFIIKT